MKKTVTVLVIIFAGILFAACSSGGASEKTRQVIFPSNAPTPVGPYSQGLLFDDTLYCAGQVGIDPLTGTLVESGTVAEAEGRTGFHN